MPFTTKAQLKTALADWLHRQSISTTADDCITLCEARLNRELGAILTEATLTGTATSREISVSANSVAEPISLFLAETGLDEVQLMKKEHGSFAYSLVAGRPSAWSYQHSTQKLYFDRPLDQAYPFRFKFRQRFSLSADGSTNWLLDNHPDVYLAAAIVWGALFTDDDAKAGKWAGVLDNGMIEIAAYIAQQNKGEASVDYGLLAIGSGGRYNIETDQ